MKTGFLFCLAVGGGFLLLAVLELINAGIFNAGSF